jgi:hypothetical protein
MSNDIPYNGNLPPGCSEQDTDIPEACDHDSEPPASDPSLVEQPVQTSFLPQQQVYWATDAKNPDAEPMTVLAIYAFRDAIRVLDTQHSDWIVRRADLLSTEEYEATL